MKLPDDAPDRIARAVQEAEGHTAAELVLTATPQSGSYADVDLYAALAAGLVFLAAVWSPPGTLEELEHDPLGLVPPLGAAISALLAGLLTASAPPVRRLLTGAGRREAQARQAAVVAFRDQGVDRTTGRTGALVHVSFFERRATLVVDRGIEAAVPPAELEALRAPFQAALDRGSGPEVVDGLCQALVGLGKALGARLPRGKDDVNELRDAPRLAT